MALHDKPVLIYDGKCGFCKIWIRVLEDADGGRDHVRGVSGRRAGLPANSGGCVQRIRTTRHALRGGSERSTRRF